MIHSVANALDERLDPFRWRDRQLASKSDRRETVGAGLFVAEGDLVVDRALQAGCTPQALLCDDDMAARFHSQLPHVDIFCGNEDLRRDVTGLGVPLRAVGLFQRPPLRDVSELLHSGSRIVVAESLDNPTNLGAIIRSAAALGWHGLVLSAGSAIAAWLLRHTTLECLCSSTQSVQMKKLQFCWEASVTGLLLKPFFMPPTWCAFPCMPTLIH